MAALDNDLDADMNEETSASLEESKLNKKKLMFILVPALVIIASIGFYYKSHNDKNKNSPVNYSIIQHNNEDSSSPYTILYDLPEVEVKLQSDTAQPQILRVKINIELSNMDSIPTIDALTAKLSDAVISHVNSLSIEDVQGSEGLYWLRKELLYRLNLITSPIKINNLNFKNFEIINGQ